MTLDEFVKVVAGEFENTPASEFTAQTHFRELEEWSSLLALSVISSIDDEFDVILTGADIRASKTIEDLYNIALSK